MPLLPDGTQLPYPDDQPEDFDSKLSTVKSLLVELAEDDGQVSEVERLEIEKILTMLQKFRADREKEHQAALGGGPATNFLRRAAGGVQ